MSSSDERYPSNPELDKVSSSIEINTPDVTDNTKYLDTEVITREPSEPTPFEIDDISMVYRYLLLRIRVITKLPNSDQSYKGKVKTHKYINRQNQSTTGI